LATSSTPSPLTGLPTTWMWMPKIAADQAVIAMRKGAGGRTFELKQQPLERHPDKGDGEKCDDDGDGAQPGTFSWPRLENARVCAPS